MAKVLAAGADELLHALPGFVGDGYANMIQGRKNTEPFGDASWRIYFQSRGAALLLQKEVMKFLIRSDMRDVPFYIKLEMSPCYNPGSKSGVQFLETVAESLSSSSAPLETKEMLNAAIKTLEIIQCPDRAVYKEHQDGYTRFRDGEIKTVSTQDRRPELAPPQGNSMASRSRDSGRPGHSAPGLCTPRSACSDKGLSRSDKGLSRLLPYSDLRPTIAGRKAELTPAKEYARNGGAKGILHTMYTL